jgi:hypothetical protein
VGSSDGQAFFRGGCDRRRRGEGDTAEKAVLRRPRLVSVPHVGPESPPQLTAMIGWLGVTFDLPENLIECIEVVECCQSLNGDAGIVISIGE